MRTSIYATVGRKQFEAALRRRQFSDDSVENIMTAYMFAKEAHRFNLPRKDGRIRFFEHPKTVAWDLMHNGFGHDEEIIILALLHDVIEDSELFSLRRLEMNFGSSVRTGVENLSKQEGESHADYLERLLQPDVRWQVLVTKLGDRRHNLLTLGALRQEQQTAKRAETRQLYLPRFDEIEQRMPAEYRPAVHHLCQEITWLCA